MNVWHPSDNLCPEAHFSLSNAMILIGKPFQYNADLLVLYIYPISSFHSIQISKILHRTLSAAKSLALSLSP
jgi:hypothetical protein